LAQGLAVSVEELLACALNKPLSVEADAPYRTDLINAAMSAQRLTNAVVAQKAGVGVMTVSKIRNGNAQVGYVTLKKVVEAVGLTMAEIARSEGLMQRPFLLPFVRRNIFVRDVI
jgi:transcriptional regulator with XRE-family HTH domain